MYFDVDGKRVFATTGGKPFDTSRPTVIFLHGSGLDHTFWGLHSRFFAFRKYSVLVPDFPGHTNSEGPPLTSIEEMADWLNDVVETLDASNISIIAHSQGCLVALEFASRYKDRLKSVSFVASGLATPVNAALIDAAENNPEAAIAMMLGWGFGPAGHLHQGPIPGNSMVAGGLKVMRGNVPGELATDLRACDNYRNGKEAAAAITCPIQVILGGKDRMAPRKAGMELVAHLDNPELHIIADSGHMVPQEAPDESRKLLRDFIFRNNSSD
jgi:pimeloyl-ACP methyl ester carboxylesterase